MLISPWAQAGVRAGAPASGGAVQVIASDAVMGAAWQSEVQVILSDVVVEAAWQSGVEVYSHGHGHDDNNSSPDNSSPPVRIPRNSRPAFGGRRKYRPRRNPMQGMPSPSRADQQTRLCRHIASWLSLPIVFVLPLRYGHLRAQGI